jgi:uncharacterized protein YndB with AHSA1/START domain
VSYAYDLARELPHRPERVWHALTDPSLLSRWFMECDQDLAGLPIGGRFTLTDPSAKGWSGILDGELLERVAPERLVYRTDERNGTSSTTLTWSLLRTGSGTRLHLHHSGWQGLRGRLTAQFLRMGWRTLIANNLNDLLANTEREADPP